MYQFCRQKVYVLELAFHLSTLWFGKILCLWEDANLEEVTLILKLDDFVCICRLIVYQNFHDLIKINGIERKLESCILHILIIAITVHAPSEPTLDYKPLQLLPFLTEIIFFFFFQKIVVALHKYDY